MPPDDAEGRGALGAERFDVGLLLHHEGGGAGDAGHAGDVDDAECEDDVEEALPQHRHQRDGQKDGGNGAEPVADPHQDVVDGFVVTGIEPDDHAEEHGTETGGDADDHRDPGAEDDPAQKVAAELVRPQKISRRAGLGKAIGHGLGQRIRRRQKRREDGKQRHDQDDQRA